MYADDIVLLATTPSQLHAMLQVLGNYASRWRFDINHDKSKVVVSGAASNSVKRAASSERWCVAGGVLDTVDSYKYLRLDLGPIKRGMTPLLIG